MSDLIDRKSINLGHVVHDMGGLAFLDDVEEYIDSIPAVDAVPVVRCRNCKYSRMYCFGCSDEPVLACCEIEEDDDGYEFIRAASSVEPDGYCSKGVRMDEEAQE